MAALALDFTTWQQTADVVDYVVTVPLGVIIAAWVHDCRHGWIVATGRLIKRCFFGGGFDSGEIAIATISGAVYRLPFDHVIWVKTGKYWPAFVMDHFRAIKKERKGRVKKCRFVR